MLFNSYVFIFAFLPLTLIFFYKLSSYSNTLGAALLVLASVFFYGYWDINYVPLLIFSVIFNYLLARGLQNNSVRTKKILLFAGVAANLLLLAYYKYFGFFLSNINTAFSASFDTSDSILPLGISFFTFTQIAYLVDTFKGQASEKNPIHYALFVTWFPQLIAGPIFHHREMMPQFRQAKVYRFDWNNVMFGLTVFSIGLFKKSFLADGISYYISDANAISPFLQASQGVSIGFFQAWTGALAYTLQLYFDFSGYSDMAIGLGLLFGVKLPTNFNSPYKACNIIDFWRRWHMTLSRFLRDYVYIPLGGNRHGKFRKQINLFITMLLGGLWHGAGWTFVIWGMMHGLFLVINHYYKALGEKATFFRMNKRLAQFITFICVVFAWVIFRSSNFDAASSYIHSMLGLNGFTLPTSDYTALGFIGYWLSQFGVNFTDTIQASLIPIMKWIIPLTFIVFFMPNTQTFMRHAKITLECLSMPTIKQQGRFLVWSPTAVWAFTTAILFIVAITQLSKPNEFLYFQF